jgi:predicted phosphodiesterase
MRYAIVSDIHANLQAWTAVLQDISCHRIDAILCLGDVVGYGPNPREVLHSVRQHADALLLGNHDAALCGMIAPVQFNTHARAILDWTQRVLPAEDHEFLASLPYEYTGYGFRCVHGEFAVPEEFRYIVTPAEALPSWQAVTEPLLFVGHTHIPGIFLIGASGKPHLIRPQDFMLEPGKRYLLNVGSIGLPRDDDTRSCYVIYDSAEQTIIWRRVAFDQDAYERTIQEAGLPSMAAFLQSWQAAGDQAPGHAPLDFQPPPRPGLGLGPRTGHKRH